MNDDLAIVDTDILSAIMRRDPRLRDHTDRYLKKHGRLTLSIITRYEILRGLKAKNAHKQQQAFDRFCSVNDVIPLSDQVVVRAAGIYADLRRLGQLISDGDILIAATAMVSGWKIVTNNESHFRRINGLVVENWLQT